MHKLLLVVPLGLALLGLVAVGSAIGNELPEVSFQSDSVSVVEDAGQVDLDVTLDTSSTLTVTVGYNTREATALAGRDYVTATGALTFTPGITLQTVSVMLVDDAVPERDESFFVVLTDTQNAVLGLYPTLTITITDDGDPYVIRLPVIVKRWPPIPYNPTLDAIANADGDGSYWVSWSESPTRLADTYVLQQAKNAAFTVDVVQACSTAEQGCALSGRGLGTFYYRVKGQNVWGGSNWSNVQSATTLPPAVPTLNAISNPHGDGSYTVSWQAAARATEYELQEDDNSAFSSPAQAYWGSGLSWSVSGKAVATYYYRVRAGGSTGASGWSNALSVVVLPPSNVQITYIFYDGLEWMYEGDEYARIKNVGGRPVNLSGWRLNAGDPGQNYYFPNYTMVAGQECRVYTDEYHPEWCGFSFGSSSALWNNGGDCGYLYDGSGTLVSSRCY